MYLPVQDVDIITTTNIAKPVADFDGGVSEK